MFSRGPARCNPGGGGTSLLEKRPSRRQPWIFAPLTTQSENPALHATFRGDQQTTCSEARTCYPMGENTYAPGPSPRHSIAPTCTTPPRPESWSRRSYRGVCCGFANPWRVIGRAPYGCTSHVPGASRLNVACAGEA